MSIVQPFVTDRMRNHKLEAAEFKGAKSEDIGALEKRMGMQFPGVYREYLSTMGWKTGHLLEGSDIRFGCLHELTSEGRALAKASGLKLPEDAFVFFAHQGYDYMYFRTGEGDDPPVYRFREGDKESQTEFKKFSDYLRWMFGNQA